MSQIQGKTVLITGASSGIGEATALLLARKGAQVVLGARRTDGLEKLTATIRSEGGLAEHCTLDVTNLGEMQASQSLDCVYSAMLMQSSIQAAGKSRASRMMYCVARFTSLALMPANTVHTFSMSIIAMALFSLRSE